MTNSQVMLQVGWQESQRGWGDGQDNLKVTAMEMLQTDANIVQKFSRVGWVWRFTFKSHSGEKSLVVHMVTTQLRECWQMRKLCKSFLMSEEFKGSHGHYTLEIGLHVNYVLKCILVKTTWRCTWKLTLGEGLISGESADKCRCCAKVFSCRKSLKVHVATTYWRKAFCMWSMC